jgi:hypothetical protein
MNGRLDWLIVYAGLAGTDGVMTAGSVGSLSALRNMPLEAKPP